MAEQRQLSDMQVKLRYCYWGVKQINLWPQGTTYSNGHSRRIPVVSEVAQECSTSSLLARTCELRPCCSGDTILINDSVNLPGISWNLDQMVFESSSVQDVPIDLLAELLHHVGLKDRLSSCAMVDKKWQQAVMMATTSIVCTANTGTALKNLSTWLASNTQATKIYELVIEDRTPILFWVRPAMQLPIANLTQLEHLQLINCSMMISSADSPELVTAPSAATPVTLAATQSGSLAALTVLSRLVLRDTLLDLSVIGSLEALQHLDLCRVGHMAEGSVSSQSAAAEDEQQEVPYDEIHDSSSMWLSQLAQLTRLTYLAVEYTPFELPKQPAASAITACLDSLGQLQRLELNITGMEATDLAHLPTSLTALSLSNIPILSPSTLPRMQQLTHLQSLHIVNAPHIDPAVLFSLVQLTSVCITSSRFQSATANLFLESELMVALQAMTSLKHLDLSNSLREGIEEPEMYAALMASSELSSLDLVDCRLTTGADEFIFPASGPQRALQVLTIGASPLSSPGVFESLVFCCPALQRLEVVSEPWAHPFEMQVPQQGLSALTSLSALTRLGFNEVTLYAGDLRSIASCSQLKELAFNIERYPATPVTDTGIMQLTQLTRLTQLALNDEMKPSTVNFLTDDSENRRRRLNKRMQLQQAITSVKTTVLARAQAINE